MKIPYIEIIKNDDSLKFLLIEDISFTDEYKELFSNYHEFWKLTNDFILALEHYFKFESIASIKECLNLKKVIDSLYKRNIVSKEESILSKLNNSDFDYRVFIYESKDIPSSSSKMGFLDLMKISNLSTLIFDKKDSSINMNNLPSKPGRGQKLCKNKECNKVIGARSLKCKFCGK